MKTIIIDLPDNLSATKVADALGLIRRDIRFGSITLTPPFHHDLNTSMGPITVRSEAEPDNQAHPPLGTTLADFTAEQLGRLPTGSRFGVPPGHPGNVIVEKVVGGWQHVGLSRPPEQADALLGCRPLIRVGPAVDHPPLNTPLSAFTPAMLDALPVGSAFGAGEEVSGVMVKDDRGWRPAAGGRYAPDFGAPGWDQTRPLIRVGPEQASESAPSAPLPDPWPGYLVAFTYADVTRRHAIRGSATVNGETVFCPAGGFSEDVYLDWTPDVVQEVRTPDGTTLWKRPAAKVTTEPETVPEAYRHAPEDSYHWKKYHAPGSPDFFPVEDCRACRDLNAKVTPEPRPLSTYTADEIRAFPVGTEIDDPKSPTAGARILRYCLLTIDGWTHGEWCDGPALTMDEFIQWEVPRQPAALVHFPAKVTP